MLNQLTAAPVAKAEMLIRRPVDEVFEALVEPSITSKFWFTRGSGRLEPHKVVTWGWAMYDLSIRVTVKAVNLNRRILIEWPGYGGPTTANGRRGPDGALVTVTNSGFSGDARAMATQAMDRPKASRWSLPG